MVVRVGTAEQYRRWLEQVLRTAELRGDTVELHAWELELLGGTNRVYGQETNRRRAAAGRDPG